MTSTPASAADLPAGDPAPEPLAPPVPVPQDQAGIDTLRLEIDSIDAELVRLIQRRTAISNAIGTARKSLGGPRIVYSREMAILERFRELGPAGTDLGMMLLSMGRGRLGRK
jgi:chorismate mutase